jgi:hypothetical protein
MRSAKGCWAGEGSISVKVNTTVNTVNYKKKKVAGVVAGATLKKGSGRAGSQSQKYPEHFNRPQGQRIATMKELLTTEEVVRGLAAQGISYEAQPTTTDLAGKVTIITSTGNASLDIYDLANALLDDEITTAEAVAKLMHIAELLAEKKGETEEIQEFLSAIEAKQGARLRKLYHDGASV